ncbi:helix-turn-helix transcriptional regulator [Micromonospora sp. NPDC005173]|uniref:helix-turn-helix transcriptional regulator n=1 Tax=Micromonospora sp. NPDC005173 TaxID=3157165 RepID=UPI0033B30254
MLRQFRTEAGVTVRAAAEALEYSRQRIWRIERASRNQRPARWSGVTYRSTAHGHLASGG